MEFHHFPDIENIDTAKVISEDYKKAPSLNTRWIVNEKIDGTNCSINITKESVALGKRNSLLGDGSSFYNIFDTYNNSIKHHIDEIQSMFDWNTYKQITLCGEYFGQKVLPRIFYGSEYQFRFFAIYTIDMDNNIYWYSFKEVYNFFDCYNIKHLLVPTIGIFHTFEDACNVPNNTITHFRTDKNTPEIEGVVIEPYDISPVSRDGNFKFKNKNPMFVEKTSRSNVSTHCETVEEKEMKKAKELFKDYCTESRMYGIFSKEGLPVSDKDVGKFLNLYINDAKKDFLKDYPQYENMTPSELKFVTNIGSLGYITYTNVLYKIKNG